MPHFPNSGLLWISEDRRKGLESHREIEDCCKLNSDLPLIEIERVLYRLWKIQTDKSTIISQTVWLTITLDMAWTSGQKL